MNSPEATGPLVIHTFEDLLYIVNTHPEWRHALVKALFPEIDLPKAFQDLSEKIAALTEMVMRLTASYENLDARTSRLEADVAVLKTDVAVLKTDVAVLKTDVGVLKKDVAELKGMAQETNYRLKAVSIFGRYIKRGRDMSNEIADQLQAAQESGAISAQEFSHVMAADLLFGGRLRYVDAEVVLVVEASWTAELSDVEWAAERAGILRKIGLLALPVVAGRQWTPEAQEQSRARRVVMAVDGVLDEDSWKEALSAAAAST